LRSVKRTLIAIILSVTLWFNVVTGKDSEEAEEEPPDALTALNASYNEIQSEATKTAQERDYKARMDVVIAEAKRKEAARVAAIVAERQRVAALVAAEVKRKAHTATAQAVPSRSQGYVGQAQTYEATFYTAFCNTGCIGVTASGYDVSSTIYYDGMRVLAAPKHIPLYSIMRVKLANGSSFDGIVLDRGGDIGNGRLDILVSNRDEAYRFGRQSVEVRMIRKGR